ncbi:immunoglobulin-like domain-containing protein [Xylocopilactobacillus apicola]|uniref:Pesticidal crystal protein Cry22Aa Ig-like domain-containing protein n=1 Tax=Xylocopilactobacillus apicola TaxID=2932184 RepID=A0AAU9DFJ2_9LACO|nr:immunoglobulin-like domain-containing protein [Xylocopilactobacillus apicola]BDR59717.1 hypothetical protein XA3_21580 [Xylocopilactobacillus apicola]
MKKTFVKYFGVASATLLAAAPAVTPALMTAAGQQTVKAAGLQDNITAAFKADNSIVPVSDADWDQLTSINVKDIAKPETNAVDKAYLKRLKDTAESARSEFATNAYNTFVNNGPADSLPLSSVYTSWMLGVGFNGSSLTNGVSVAYIGNLVKDQYGTVNKYNQVTFSSWAAQFDNDTKVDKDHGETPLSSTYFWGDKDQTKTVGDYTKEVLAAQLKQQIANLPLWWFVTTTSKPAVAPYNVFTSNIAGVANKINGKQATFTPLDSDDAGESGYVTVVPNGGTDTTVVDENDPSISFVGDNLVNLQTYTEKELINLVPAKNRGVDKSGNPFNDIAGKFKVGNGYVTAAPANEGSKVWNVILKSMMNPKDASFPLKDLTTTGIYKARMIVNGKDPLKNEFITKDEIKNADRISIQMIFKDSGQNEYKTPTIWLSHNAKYTVDTSGLGNITRLPGDFYSPSFGINGIDNATGLPMDSKRFVVVPAGTNLADYTDSKNNIDLTALASLTGGIVGTDALAANDPFGTSMKGSGLATDNYSTDPNLYYSKFGSYNDAVDIYYINAAGKVTSTTTVGKETTAAQSRVNAAKAVNDAVDEYMYSIGTGAQVKAAGLIDVMYKAAAPYLDGTKVKNVTDFKNIYVDLTKYDIPVTGGTAKTGVGSDAIANLVIDHTKTFYFNPNSSRTSDGIFDNYGRNNSKPDAHTAFQSTLGESINQLIMGIPDSRFVTQKDPDSKPNYTVPATNLDKIVANAGRTTKVDVPSKYLPQVSFDTYTSGASYYGNGATINNWFNYGSLETSAAANDNPYYPSGGVIVSGTGSSASSAAPSKSDAYFAPASFTANYYTADQLKARVTDNIQKYMTAKLSNPNTETDSKTNGYFNAYSGAGIKGDAATAYIANGAIPAEDLTIDTSKVDVTKPGKYEITVTYKPLQSINKNVDAGNTNKKVAITDAQGHLFKGGALTTDVFGSDKVSPDTATASEDGSNISNPEAKLSRHDADQIFANGAPATYTLPIEITDGSGVVAGSPVIAFTSGGQNVTIAKGAQFDPYKGIQFFARPGAAAWKGQGDDSLDVKINGQINTNVEGTYTLNYVVTNKAGKVSKLTRVITVGSGVEAPTETAFNMSPAYIDYVPGYNVRAYSAPRAEWTGKQLLHGTSVQVTNKAVYSDGETWYKLSDGSYVKAEYVKAGQAPDTAVDATGTATVTYVPGYGIAVYTGAGSAELVQEAGAAKRLPDGTAWKVFKKQTVAGVTYYNLGGNQWVDGRYVSFK